MEKVVTEDGSFTFYNEQFQDHYHSKSGAFEESVQKFALPCKEVFTKTKIIIYDICFGLGYNTTATIHEIWKVNPACTIIVYAFENDKTIINQMKSMQVPSQYVESFALVCAGVQSSQFKLIFINGDFRETLKKVNDKADIVLFDPFKPRSCPELWSKQVFQVLFEKMNHKSVLTTYSCAHFVRSNMRLAGFTVINGPVVGRRSPSTVAWKTSTLSPI